MSDAPNSSEAWRLVQVVDLWVATHDCEHCRNERVRYVHVLSHSQLGELRVGCVCAGKLTGDAAGAAQRERSARNEAKRYDTWAAPEHWAIESDRHTRPGRHQHWDYMAMVYQVPDGWRWMLVYSGGKFRGTALFASAEEARRDLWLTQLR